jgi:hypothetical protein
VVQCNRQCVLFRNVYANVWTEMVGVIHFRVVTLMVVPFAWTTDTSLAAPLASAVCKDKVRR